MALLRTLSILTLAAGVTLPLAGAARPSAEPTATLAAVVADRNPALVTIKFVINVSFQGQSQELDRESGGFFIDGKNGLILANNFEMGGGFGTHKDIKVLIGDDTEGVPAKIIGRDSEMELMWLRIEKPSDKGYTAVDPSKNATPKVGDKLIGIDRMGKFFDRTPVAFEVMVGGIAKKPRSLFIPTGGTIGNIGLPMFTAAGEFAGVSVVQRANSEEEGGMDAASQGRTTSYDRGLKVLAASEIVTATQRALDAEKSGHGMGMEEKKEEEKKPEGEAKPEEKKEPTPAEKPTEMPKR